MSLAGFLVYKKPQKHAVQSPASPSVFIIPLAVSPSGMTQEESYAVGTRCGTSQFHQDRVNEYMAFKQGRVSMSNLVFQYDSMLTLAEYKNNWRFYHNKQMKKWFGDDLVDVY